MKEVSFRNSGPVTAIQIPKFRPSDNDGESGVTGLISFERLYSGQALGR